MIREQNYIKIAEYTKRTFKMYCRRSLANTILKILQKKKLK
jgi:hypothetical protein